MQCADPKQPIDSRVKVPGTRYGDHKELELMTYISAIALLLDLCCTLCVWRTDGAMLVPVVQWISWMSHVGTLQYKVPGTTTM